MAKRHKRWARIERSRLMLLLGSKCALCSATTNLEFDCKKPCGDAHHKMDTSARMSFYRKQHAQGNLQILCTKCNNKKSADEQDRLPF